MNSIMSPPVTAAEYFAGKNIFITGATGFIGKAMVEKLLRCCPRLGNIYMLMRPKYGHSVGERLHKFLECPIFDSLRKSSPECFSRLKVVSGDITADALGLSDDERSEVLRECNIVFHAAACVRFDLSLRSALSQNTRATQRVLQLAEAMGNLEVFVHISTSYCQHANMVLEEKVYPTEHSPQRIMELVDWMTDDMIAGIQPKLIFPHGNTYAFTKALSETVVSQYAGKFPIVIARLTIVGPSMKEPIPGWVDNLNGPTGIMIATGKGVLRTMMCNDDIQADVAPLDISVNACILSAYLTGVEKPQDIRVCNITQSGVNVLTWREYKIKGLHIMMNEYPFFPILWVPEVSAKTSRVYHNITAFFVHFIPALLIDSLLYLLGKKRFMMKVYERVRDGIDVLGYYTTRPWTFTNEYFRSLKTRVSKEDDAEFYTDMAVLDWNNYMRNYIKGAQIYVLKQDPADRARAKRLLHILCSVDKILTVIFWGCLLYIMYRVISVY